MDTIAERGQQEMTDVVTPTLGKIEDAVERFGLYAISQIWLNAVFVAWPVLGTWPLAQIIRTFTEILCDKAFAALRVTVDLKVIRFLDDKNLAAYEREVLKLRALGRGYGPESPQFKKARDDAKASFIKFAHFNGA